MRCPSTMPHDDERLKILGQYELSAVQPLPALDLIVRLAARTFDVRASAVNMIGKDEVFFAASTGIGECDKRRDVSFCAHAILQDDVMVVCDARLDARFHDNPLVTGPTKLRFYAGVPVRSPEGLALGVLCVIDDRPRAYFPSRDKLLLKEMAALVMDKLERHRLEVASRRSAERFEQFARSSPNGVICLGEHGIITMLNPAAEAIFGYAEAEAIGIPVTMLLPGWEDSLVARWLAAAAPGDHPVDTREELVGRHIDGTDVPVELGLSTWVEGSASYFGLIIRDLSEQRRHADALYRCANFDPVTGIANRNLILDHLGEALPQSQPASLLLIGLHDFHALQNAFGQDIGDEIRKIVVQRLQASITPLDFLAAFSEDEFALLLADTTNPLHGSEVARSAMEAISHAMVIDGREYHIGAHCGIVVASDGAPDAAEFLGNASLALQEARKESPRTAFTFVPALRMQAVARRMFEEELHQAVERNELELFYQPQVRLSDGTLNGAEALIRWNHPQRGLLSPAAFLPALEASTLTAEVGNWIIERAFGQTQQWRAILCPDFRMSINLFAAQFRFGDLENNLQTALERFELPFEAIGLEITETIILDDEGLFLPPLQRLRDLGVKIAFDDFGTGYASLSLLNRYPLTHLKIDKSFVQSALNSARDRAIMQTITDLAHQLDLHVIAEGVEDTEQLSLCRSIGCDEVQGYLTGKPMAADRFERSWREPARNAGHRFA